MSTSAVLLEFDSGSSYPAQREENLPALSLEKLVPGGIAEMSPWRCRVGEGKDVSRWPRN